jgi:hypothetical protein
LSLGENKLDWQLDVSLTKTIIDSEKVMQRRALHQ